MQNVPVYGFVPVSYNNNLTIIIYYYYLAGISLAVYVYNSAQCNVMHVYYMCIINNYFLFMCNSK